MNKYIIAIVALIGYQATLGGGFDGLKAQLKQGQLTRQQRQTDDESTQARQISMDKLTQQAPIANKRYAAGCQLLVSSENNQNSMALVIGEPVRVSGTGVYLSVGNLVCDANGLTAEIVQGTYQGKPTPVAGLEARTMDQAVIQGAIARYEKRGINIKQNAQ